MIQWRLLTSQILMTTTFYVEPALISHGRVEFPEGEARHLASVLRHREGDVVRVMDGEGHAFTVRLTAVTKSKASGEVIAVEERPNELTIHVTLAIGLLKNRSKIELVVEKATELGAAGIIPLITERSERSTIRLDRLESIAVAAMKQCGRAVKPVIHAPVDFESVVDDCEADRGIICHEGSIGRGLALDARTDQSVLMMIGPEGGFSAQEVELARGAGFAEWYLGTRRLRAETAAIASMSALALWSEGVLPRPA